MKTSDKLVNKLYELKKTALSVKDKVKKEALELIGKVTKNDNCYKLIVGSSIVSILCSMVVVGSSIKESIHISNNYLSQEELYEYCESLECDTSYILTTSKDNMLRMQHNNGEPVYVCIDENLSDFEKECIKKSLDKMFGLVGRINNKYYYKIVNKFEYKTKFNKTRIYYTLGELEERVGGRMNGSEIYDNGDVALIRDYTVYLDLENFKYLNYDYETVVEYSINHETFHLFGIDDVYNSNKQNTYINVHESLNGNIDDLTPNDVRCLIALYADKNKTNPENIEEYYKDILDYYYNNYITQIVYKQQLEQSFYYENFIFNAYVTSSGDDNKENFIYDYKITVQDGHYEFELIDGLNNRVLKSCSGNARVQNGIVLLENVNMFANLVVPYSEYYLSKNYIKDLIIANEKGYVGLKVANDDSEFIYGKIEALEKEATL